MITIISATNRPDSNSIRIADYYAKLLHKKGVESQLLDLASLPQNFIFSALYDNVGKDTAFNELTRLVGQSEKFIFIVPEYNGSFPGVLKAFIDGLNYPNSFKDKKAALVGISTGVMGGALALSHLTDVLNYLGMNVLAIKPRLPRVHLLYKEGKINDAFLEGLLESQAEAFVRF